MYCVYPEERKKTLEAWSYTVDPIEDIAKI